jgi:hypothetical protein
MITSMTSYTRVALRLALAGTAISAGSYAAWFGRHWYRYGHPRPATRAEADPLLDQFMPAYDVVDRHAVRLNAPAETALAAACAMDWRSSAVIRAIVKARAWLLRADPDALVRPQALLPSMTSLGWNVLAEVPGREIVVGAVTQPWIGDVVFRPLASASFARYFEPGYVKIVWTLRADPDPVDPDRCVFRTETRAVATDPSARERFRWYWSCLSPGIVLMRLLLVSTLKAESERSAHAEDPRRRPRVPATCRRW